MSPFKFNLSEKAVVTRSGETGTIEGRTEYVNFPNNYWLQYTAADGRATEGWFTEYELSVVE